MSTVVIYHGNCADGFTAAWAARKAIPDAEFYAGVYQSAPPDVSGTDVIFVDFSYKADVMRGLAEKANSIVVLDHHKSAIDDLNPLVTEGLIYAVFDTERSGAGITWDHFFGSGSRPALVSYVEDRDLWRFNLPYSREVNAAVFSRPYTFEAWDELAATPVEKLRIEGTAIERKHFKDIEELLGVTTRWFFIGGEKVPLANLPYTLTSDAGHMLCKKYGTPFAGCYWDTPDGRVFSLRSLDDGADVQAVAKQYGGGGHVHAAGFRVPYDSLPEAA